MGMTKEAARLVRAEKTTHADAGMQLFLELARQVRPEERAALLREMVNVSNFFIEPNLTDQPPPAPATATEVMH